MTQNKKNVINISVICISFLAVIGVFLSIGGDISNFNAVFASIFFLIIGFIVSFALCGLFKSERLFIGFFIATMFLINNICIWNTHEFYGIDSTWDYGDFVVPIKSGYGSLYGTNYPPFAVLIFKLFYIFSEKSLTSEYAVNYSVFLYGLIAVLCMFITGYTAFRKSKRVGEHEALFMSMTIMLSSQVIFSLQRLNLVFVAIVLLELWYIWYESSSKAIKNFGLIALALSANVKIYPAIFGLVLVKKKRWKDAFITAFWGIFFFLSPAVLERWEGSGENLLTRIWNFIGAVLGFVGERGEADGMSLRYLVYRLIDEFNISISIADKEMWGTITLVMFIIMTIILFFFSKKEYNDFILLACMCIFVPAVSYWYSTLFILMAIISFFNVNEKMMILDKIEIVLISLIYAFVQPYSTILHTHSTWHIILLYCIVVIRIFYEEYVEIKDKEVWQNILQFVKFGLVGVSNTLISYIIYVALNAIGVNYVVASIIGFTVSVANSFYWNNKYVFKEEGEKKRSIWKTFAKTYISYAGTGLILSNILLVLFVEVCHIHKLIAPLLCYVITIPMNFLINKFWAYKK